MEGRGWGLSPPLFPFRPGTEGNPRRRQLLGEGGIHGQAPLLGVTCERSRTATRRGGGSGERPLARLARLLLAGGRRGAGPEPGPSPAKKGVKRQRRRASLPPPERMLRLALAPRSPARLRPGALLRLACRPLGTAALPAPNPQPEIAYTKVRGRRGPRPPSRRGTRQAPACAEAPLARPPPRLSSSSPHAPWPSGGRRGRGGPGRGSPRGAPGKVGRGGRGGVRLLPRALA